MHNDDGSNKYNMEWGLWVSFQDIVDGSHLLGEG